MSDRFRPIAMEQLTTWAFSELDAKGSVFGIPRAAFFTPRADDPFRTRVHGVDLETPWGVAAGPHTQMAQNIVAAWLVGARVIELKTVQTLDELNVNKPCIDATDEGYNVEWSQELRVHESFDEYLRAWVLIHALHRHLGLPGEAPGVLFNMSVGYNLEGILRPNVQWYLDAMRDASAFLPAYLEIVARHVPGLRPADVPARLSDTVTLSTMHGCPPGEIEAITRYLLEERGLHTSVKCNPTLLGAARVRGIVNEDLGFRDIPIPDMAFGHDLAWADAIPMFGRLAAVARERGLDFGLKLSNTLEVDNWRGRFEHDATMYMSGRPLHAVTVNLAAALDDELAGAVPISFAGGADAFNLADLLASGIRTVTVCSDLLKTGGYLRLRQYADEVAARFAAAGARDPASLAQATAAAAGRPAADATAAARGNLRAYAAAVRRDPRYRKDTYRTDRSKTARTLGAFDCIAAPCMDTCPVDQDVPRYMDAVRRGAFDEAVAITRRDNPLACVLGRVCDHLCELTCVRTHLDEPLAIRQIKRFIMEHEMATDAGAAEPGAGAHGPAASSAAPTARVAIIGAGPAGLAAARDLALAGATVTIFEAQAYPGGMVGGAIPAYRLPQESIDRDVDEVTRLGVEIRYGVRAGADITLDGLWTDGYAATFVAVGAQRAKRLGLPGEDSAGVLDGITFLRSVREGRPIAVGPRVGVVGAGDTAMDCARSALRVGAREVTFIYRRTVDQMPADPEEIHACREEGIGFVELARPAALRVEAGRLAGVTCTRTAYAGARDASGRKVAVDVPDSTFEVPLDTLLLAISQHPVLDLFGDEPPTLAGAGQIATDPATLATSIPGVWAGGDVADHGPASIVRAAADGRRAAAAIAAALGLGVNGGSGAPGADSAWPAVDLAAEAVRRGQRAWRVSPRSLPVVERTGFTETALGYTAEEAQREAARCLDCDRSCSLCVGVCPNLALLTYETEPRHLELALLTVHGGAALPNGTPEPFAIAQRPQVAVLTDFCNECGNCVTACPTAGAPYRDKPRLYLDRADFEAEPANAFLLAGPGRLEGRFDGRTHRLALGDRIAYEAPGFAASLDRATLAVETLTLAGAAEGERLSLRPAAVMAALLEGLATTHAHLPGAGSGSVRLAAPDLSARPEG